MIKKRKQEIARTCLICRRAKVKCDKTNPCGRCARLGVECKPPGPCQRGKWQTERAISRRVENFAPYKSHQDPFPPKNPCSYISLDTFERASVPFKRGHFGVIFFVRTLIAKGLRRNDWAYFSTASRLATKVGVSMSDVFMNDVDNDNKIYFQTHDKGKKEFSRHMFLSLKDIPLQILKVFKINPVEGPNNRRFFGIKKIDGQAFYYVSASFENKIISREEIAETGDERMFQRMFPKTQWEIVGKYYAKQFGLYETKDSLPVCSKYSTSIVLKNGSIENVVVKTCLYIVDDITSFYLAEFSAQKTSLPTAKKSSEEELVGLELNDMDVSFIDFKEDSMGDVSRALLETLKEWG
jgi:hypothetical protein